MERPVSVLSRRVCHPVGGTQILLYASDRQERKKRTQVHNIRGNCGTVFSQLMTEKIIGFIIQTLLNVAIERPGSPPTNLCAAMLKETQANYIDLVERYRCYIQIDSLFL